jgi:hypothetical protein
MYFPRLSLLKRSQSIPKSNRKKISIYTTYTRLASTNPIPAIVNIITDKDLTTPAIKNFQMKGLHLTLPLHQKTVIRPVPVG